MHSSSLPRHDPSGPIFFEEFFEMGKEELFSPFLRPSSRRWASYLTLKASVLSAVLLFFSFLFSFSPTWLSLSHFLLVCVYFFAGIPALIEAVEDLALFDVNIDILMTLAAFSSVFIGSGMEGGLLLVLFALSGAMEDAVTSKAKGSLKALHKLSPTVAFVWTESGDLIQRSVRDIIPGDRILIKAGEVVPLDGIVVDGVSSVNMGHLTGESVPLTKKVDDTVAAGARNLEGAMTLSVTHTSADSTLSRIIQLVTRAQAAKPRLQRWFDTWSRTYAITIILISFLFVVFYPWISNIPYAGIEGSIYRGLAFLIAASPCALIIAIPIAYLSAVSACAKEGFLIKGGISLDALASCTVVAFDKTGTLTTGDLQCIGVASLQENPVPPHVVSIALALERNAVHPMAKGILAYGKKQGIPPTSISSFQTLPGYGLIGTLETGDNVYIGNIEGAKKRLSPDRIENIEQAIVSFREAGEMIAVLLIKDDVFFFRFVDTIRYSVPEMIQRLQKERHLATLMLTGDHLPSAERVAREVGVDTTYAELRPEDKLRYVEQLAQEKGLAMVGDGMNDAPALARATVGISMGEEGSMAAADAADVVLLHDRIDKLDWLFQKAHQTVSVVRENLILAAGAILLAALPALAGVVPLWLAVILHEGGTILVGLNGLRLLRR